MTATLVPPPTTVAVRDIDQVRPLTAGRSRSIAAIEPPTTVAGTNWGPR